MAVALGWMIRTQIVFADGSWYSCVEDASATANDWVCAISPGVDSATANSLSVNAAQ